MYVAVGNVREEDVGGDGAIVEHLQMVALVGVGGVAGWYWVTDFCLWWRGCGTRFLGEMDLIEEEFNAEGAENQPKNVVAGL